MFSLIEHENKISEKNVKNKQQKVIISMINCMRFKPFGNPGV